ncbi:MAG: hypothetical protein KUL82_00080 [Bdellovibrio sp.]|nr:hypothetical protein [Bdellovibrio sp.]
MFFSSWRSLIGGLVIPLFLVNVSHGQSRDRILSSLALCQSEGGGFSEEGEGADLLLSQRVLFAAALLGESPANWQVNGKGPDAYFVSEFQKLPESLRRARILVFVSALALLQGDEHEDTKDKVLKILDEQYVEGQFGSPDLLIDDARFITMLPLLKQKGWARNWGPEKVASIEKFILSHQREDGGWAFSTKDLPSDIESSLLMAESLNYFQRHDVSKAKSKVIAYIKKNRDIVAPMTSQLMNSVQLSQEIYVRHKLNFPDSKIEKEFQSYFMDNGYFRWTKSTYSNPCLVTALAVSGVVKKGLGDLNLQNLKKIQRVREVKVSPVLKLSELKPVRVVVSLNGKLLLDDTFKLTKVNSLDPVFKDERAFDRPSAYSALILALQRRGLPFGNDVQYGYRISEIDGVPLQELNFKVNGLGSEVTMLQYLLKGGEELYFFNDSFWTGSLRAQVEDVSFRNIKGRILQNKPVENIWDPAGGVHMKSSFGSLLESDSEGRFEIPRSLFSGTSYTLQKAGFIPLETVSVEPALVWGFKKYGPWGLPLVFFAGLASYFLFRKRSRSRDGG